MLAYTALLILALSGTAFSATCDLKLRHQDKEFPNIEKEGVVSYKMSVEYTLPEANITDFFTEYYDVDYRRGRIDGHQEGENMKYIYYAKTMEGWNIKNRECNLQNSTDIPDLIKHSQKYWMYTPSDPDRVTAGPSAMFKLAYDYWNTSDHTKIAYMGPSPKTIDGMEAIYWRWCKPDDIVVDYYFAADDVEDSFSSKGLKVKNFPLRVAINGKESVENEMFAEEYFDILKFAPYIVGEDAVFQLPKGRNCQRGDLVKTPSHPDLKAMSFLLSAETVYRQINMDDWQDNSSYYSILTLGFDRAINHMSYSYTPWKSAKDPDDAEQKNPVHVVYDLTHNYQYITDLETGQCDIARTRSFQPYYEIPDKSGKISLTDPYVLFTNNETQFLQEGTTRGMKVNEFEAYVEGYVVEKDNEMTQVPKAYITHSFLTDSEKMDNTASTKNALIQVQHRYQGRKENKLELLTFNVYGFTTSIEHRSEVFSVSECYLNDDDYLWAVIGFNLNKDQLPVVARLMPTIRFDIMSYIQTTTELNPVRIPITITSLREDRLDVIMVILGKPPLELDFPDLENKTTITNPAASQGASQFESCATKCLEEMGNCWGFSMCGNVCYFPSENSETTTSADCYLYRRFSNESYVPSKENQADTLRKVVNAGEFQVVFTTTDKDNNIVPITLTASSIQINSPGEDDDIFTTLGNRVDPRMRVSKVGYKLKKGNAVKNMGKLRYDECQRLCLDFKDCETMSFCLKNSECIISSRFDVDIPDGEKEADNTCNLLARKYSDNFQRSPGIILSKSAKSVKGGLSLEQCARACLKETGFQCLSFDHCPQAENEECRLHTVHYINPSVLENMKTKESNCGHYFRKYSTEFKRARNSKTVGATVPPINNVTLEECSKTCIDYGKGMCYGFDYCQDRTLYSTTCTLLDSDPSRLKKAFSPICTNYLRTEPEYAPRPYSSGYAGGIGFLCFLIGGLVGAAIVFGIAYFKVNRR